MEKPQFEQHKEGVPQLKYGSKMEQRIMGDITGNRFPKDPSRKGLPFFGETEEQSKATIENARIILNNSAMLDEFCIRSKRYKQYAIEHLQRLVGEKD